MKIVLLSPGAGMMYCGNCFRDNDIAAELNRQGHDVCTVPLYLPPMLDEPETGSTTPIFFGGVSVYLEQKLPFFRLMPRFVHRMLASRRLLNIIGSRAASTQPSQVGDLTVSMLQGEHGKQSVELGELCRFLKHEQPDAVCFSNALLLGMHAQIKSETGAKTICTFGGEDSFLDSITEPFRAKSWNIIKSLAADVDVLTAPSMFYAAYMSQRLELSAERIHVVPPGINLQNDLRNDMRVEHINVRTLGFFARLTREKGLDTLVDAFIEIRKRGNVPTLKLKIGGGLSTNNKPFVQQLEDKLSDAGLLQETEFLPNRSREKKVAFLQSLTLFSVPSRLNEPFGRFVLESFAAGVPGIFPNDASFPEIAELSGACALFEPENSVSLADAAEELLGNEQRLKELSHNALRAVQERWNIRENAKRFAELLTA